MPKTPGLAPYPIISLCVTTHNRAAMLRDVITSYWSQDFTASELLVLDDASTDETQALMQAAARLDARIVYLRNSKTLGYCENFHRSLVKARGQYIVVLGDDDILLGPTALTRFAEVFVRHPDVHFAYPNQIQMDSNMNFDILYRHFDVDAYFGSGSPSFRSTWLKSVLITGIALRRSEALYRYYPTSTMLFPQVELVGRLLSHHASYGIADFLVAPRAHADQLGFHANRRQRIVGAEKHGTIEVLDIVAKLNLDNGKGPDPDYTARLLAHALATNLPNEKLRGSTRIAVSNVYRLMRRSRVARGSPILLLSLIVTASAPPQILGWLRSTAKNMSRRRHSRAAEWFAAELSRQRDCAASRWRSLDGEIATA